MEPPPRVEGLPATRGESENFEETRCLCTSRFDGLNRGVALSAAVGRRDCQTFTLEHLTRLRFRRERYRQQLERTQISNGQDAECDGCRSQSPPFGRRQLRQVRGGGGARESRAAKSRLRLRSSRAVPVRYFKAFDVLRAGMTTFQGKKKVYEVTFCEWRHHALARPKVGPRETPYPLKRGG